MELRSYPKILALGHAGLADLLTGWVVVQEKVDGSQISFGKRGDSLVVRSKSSEIHLEAVPKLFAAAVTTIEELWDKLVDGWTYRGEALQGPKHNTLHYERVPKGNVLLYDVDTGYEKYGSPRLLEDEAARLGLEVVPKVWEGNGSNLNLDMLKAFLSSMSILGGTKIEGVVIKAYGLYDRGGKTIMGKYVSEAFKEKHTGEWKKANPSNKDVVMFLTSELRSEERWEKAIQHLRESGTLQSAPQDIGPLLKEIAIDTLAEERDHIKEVLFNRAWKQIQRGITQGFAQWYKERLAKEQFNGEDAEPAGSKREDGVDDAAQPIPEAERGVPLQAGRGGK